MAFLAKAIASLGHHLWDKHRYMSIKPLLEYGAVTIDQSSVLLLKNRCTSGAHDEENGPCKIYHRKSRQSFTRQKSAGAFRKQYWQRADQNHQTTILMRRPVIVNINSTAIQNSCHCRVFTAPSFTCPKPKTLLLFMFSHWQHLHPSETCTSESFLSYVHAIRHPDLMCVQ